LSKRLKVKIEKKLRKIEIKKIEERLRKNEIEKKIE